MGAVLLLGLCFGVRLRHHRPMSGAGTNTTLIQSGRHGPVIILVEPQLAENIGMVARAMANFGLSELRLVQPRDGWPVDGGLPQGAQQAASGATHILSAATLFADVPAAIADLNLVYATTARERGQMKQVMTPAQAMPEACSRIASGQRIGILFGRERTGLENEEVSLADAILSFPVDPAFASLNLAQAVLLTGYAWYQASHGDIAPIRGTIGEPARRESLISLIDFLAVELDRIGYFQPEKRDGMVQNLRDILIRREMSEQDVRSLRGALVALVRGRG